MQYPAFQILECTDIAARRQGPPTTTAKQFFRFLQIFRVYWGFEGLCHLPCLAYRFQIFIATAGTAATACNHRRVETEHEVLTML